MKIPVIVSFRQRQGDKMACSQKSYWLHQLLSLFCIASCEWKWPHDPEKVAFVGVPNRYSGVQNVKLGALELCKTRR